jgi:uncharacterized membrane protein YphA (DoxX/SURF4 family)
MRTKAIAYWLVTVFLLLNVLSGALAELARLPGNVAGMIALGYPLYLMTILGVWKILGTIAVLVPRFPRLKEWAYAGIFFNMSGAAISHVVAGDAAWHALYTGSLAVLTIASWALRPQSRTLGVLLPDRSWELASTHGALSALPPSPTRP